MSDLALLLQRELELLEAFAAVLSEESSALERGEADALPVLANKKSPLISALDAAGSLRNRWLAQQGYGPDLQGVEACIAATPSAQTLQALWQRFLSAARKARELNAYNAQLLNQQLVSTSEALAALGQEARRQALYGADGQPSLSTGNRVIDSA